MHRSAPLFLNSIALLGMAALAGCENTGTAQTAPTPAAARSVTAAKLERKRFELTTVQPAVIQAFEETPLYAKIAGYVEEVAVDIGDRVQKGQVLVRLSVPELRETLGQKSALVAQAEAEIAQAAAAIRAAEASRASAQASVHHADAGVVRARADYDRWHSEFTRLEQLAANGSVTSKLVDEARHQFQSAEAAQAEAAAALEAAKAGGLEKEANIAQARADADTAQAKLRVAEAERDQARTMLAYTELRAPFDGIITRREIDPGHYVQPTVSTPLLVVTHADVVRVFADVPETEAALVDPGDAASVATEGPGGSPIPGKVTRTSWSLAAANRSLRTEVDLPNTDGRLRPGMYAVVSLLLDARDDAIVLPAAAVVRDGDKAFCYTVAAGKAIRTPIALGLRSGDELEVVSGLKGDETVVLAHAESLTDGESVAIAPPAPAK